MKKIKYKSVTFSKKIFQNFLISEEINEIDLDINYWKKKVDIENVKKSISKIET